MKTTEHGIEDSRDVENVYHMRLMALLKELVRDKGYKGAARVLELDQRTVAESAKTGQLSRRVRQALERALQEGVGSAAARQRERNEKLEERVEALEKGHEALEKGSRRRWARRCAGEWQPSRAGSKPCVGTGHRGPGPVTPAPVPPRRRRTARRPVVTGMGRKPPPRPRLRREYPDLVTLEPAPDDEEVFGDAWPMIVEWRGLKDVAPQRGEGPGLAAHRGALPGVGAGPA